MTGKEKVINYCIRILEKISDEHLTNCREVRYLLKSGDEDNYFGLCPISYGLDDYIGLCEIENNDGKLLAYDEQVKRCKKVLGDCIEIKGDKI